jgi:DNA-binding NarL/FixJ family response regulator
MPVQYGNVRSCAGPDPGALRTNAGAPWGRDARVTHQELRAPPLPRAGVLVLDEEMLVRAGLRAVIESDRRFTVVAEASDAARAIDAASRFQPQLAIVGSHGGAIDVVEATRRLHAACPVTSIVLMARLEDGVLVLEGMRAGAIGFVRTGVERVELLSALSRALAGESVVDPSVAAALITRMASESDFAPRALPDPLTPREVQILRLVARGETNREIASSLILAVGTIKVHVEHILVKLGVNDRTQAAVRAVELGIVGHDGPDGATGSGHRAA